MINVRLTYRTTYFDQEQSQLHFRSSFHFTNNNILKVYYFIEQYHCLMYNNLLWSMEAGETVKICYFRE